LVEHGQGLLGDSVHLLVGDQVGFGGDQAQGGRLNPVRFLIQVDSYIHVLFCRKAEVMRCVREAGEDEVVGSEPRLSGAHEDVGEHPAGNVLVDPASAGG
jgi:acetoacetate decarboxylase